jgi:hypothetical protein
MIVNHQTVIGFVKLPDNVTVVRTEHQKARAVAYRREIERIIHLFDLKTGSLKNESHGILGFFPHIVFHDK